jgi:hypothetical protein
MIEETKPSVSMKEMLTKRSFEPITNCNCVKDKEKQIFDKYGNYDFPTDIKQDGLNTATTQIEEMAKVLHDRIINKTWRAEKVAKELYKIVLPEDSVVLSKAKYEMLTACSSYEGVMSKLKDEYIRGSKETAEKFYNKVNENICVFKLEITDENYNSGYARAISDVCERLDQVAKQFGVEIKG